MIGPHFVTVVKFTFTLNG